MSQRAPDTGSNTLMDAIAASSLHIRIDRYSASPRRKKQEDIQTTMQERSMRWEWIQRNDGVTKIDFRREDGWELHFRRGSDPRWVLCYPYPPPPYASRVEENGVWHPTTSKTQNRGPTRPSTTLSCTERRLLLASAYSIDKPPLMGPVPPRSQISPQVYTANHQCNIIPAIGHRDRRLEEPSPLATVKRRSYSTGFTRRNSLGLG